YHQLISLENLVTLDDAWPLPNSPISNILSSALTGIFFSLVLVRLRFYIYIFLPCFDGYWRFEIVDIEYKIRLQV
ncbi:MAG: hypothetical protein Q8835_03250, partial [Sweet potato little leaf phytoplasma]|nr:hypothetical protein [Sweet potato little leaf phytoplasma]